MLVVSLHKIVLHAPLGLYAEEHVLGNTFEVDVDMYLPDAEPWPYADYTVVHAIVSEVFNKEGLLLETFVSEIHKKLKATFLFAEKIKVAVRKLNPPLQGQVAYSQVMYEG